MRTLILAAALALFTAPIASAESAPPVEAFGRLPAVADAAISPDGSKIALASNLYGVPRVVVVKLNGDIVFTARVEEASQLRAVGWADDTHVTFLLSRAFAPGQVLPAGVSFRAARAVGMELLTFLAQQPCDVHSGPTRRRAA